MSTSIPAFIPHLMGKNGEDYAVEYLMKHHYIIRSRNVRFGRYEIDIVAYDETEKMIVFIEVKTRRAHSDAYPIHSSLTSRKRSAMRKAVQSWIFNAKYDGPSRIDLLSIHQGKVVEHIRAVGSDFLY